MIYVTGKPREVRLITLKDQIFFLPRPTKQRNTIRHVLMTHVAWETVIRMEERLALKLRTSTASCRTRLISFIYSRQHRRHPVSHRVFTSADTLDTRDIGTLLTSENESACSVSTPLLMS